MWHHTAQDISRLQLEMQRNRVATLIPDSQVTICKTNSSLNPFWYIYKYETVVSTEQVGQGHFLFVLFESY